ncbi:hypothetical protein [Nitrincola nitratireducens]|uniref:2-keto-4-pentenoate hydratase n=1 Tax=Nitrincola nitratireducens TaxID=1229521 RepID=W9UZD6_9GAMM|nr:hypothetical protein [Nitrincola nitratireducens]EXJ12603.1 2-keto-4-pentenoate hydratase [Nitrincola nitratireducens]
MNIHQETAAYLNTLWTTNEICSDLPSHLKPTTLEEGYRAQEAFIHLSQSPCTGWKLGVASENQLTQAQLNRPLVGRILSNRCFEKNKHVVVPESGVITIEGEIGLILKHDILPNRVEPISWMDVSHICLTFEIVRSRFINRRAVGWPSFVADNVGFEALITSDPLPMIPCDTILDELLHKSYIELDGQAIAYPLQDKDGINPLTSLTHLANHARQENITLYAGELVSTGAFYKPFDLPHRNHGISAIYPWNTFGFSV